MTTKINGKNRRIVLKIIVSLLYVAMGVEGFVLGKSGQAIGHLYKFIANFFGKAGDSFVIVVAAVISLSGLCVLASTFFKKIPGKVVSVSMIVLMVVWTLAVVFADFVDGFGDVNDFVALVMWLEPFLIHVLVLSATVFVYGGEVK